MVDAFDFERRSLDLVDRDMAEQNRIASQSMKAYNEVYVVETPVFNYLLDLWLYCKARGADFSKRKRLATDQGQWTLQS